MSSTRAESNSDISPARRLRAIQARTSDPDLAAIIDEVAALEDRQLYTECALHHVCDHLGIDPHALPDPFHPPLYVEVPA